MNLKSLLLAVAISGGIFAVVPPAFTQTWTQTSAPILNWSAVASSADGTRLVAAVSGGLIYASTNSGANWTATRAPSTNWSAAASSADGTRLVVVVNGGGIHISPDAGVTWTAADAPNTNWSAVASSADGGKWVATVHGGGVYTSQSILAPLLGITSSSGDRVIAWTVPSTSFGLQQNSDLSSTTWTEVPATPALNYTNLQNQTIVPLLNAHRFYRLKH